MKMNEIDNKKKPTYFAYELDPQSRSQLMQIFPPKYVDVIGHHITYKFGIKHGDQLPGECKEIKVFGYVDNGESLEALIVELDGERTSPDGRQFHITWSLDRSKGMKPVHSNDVIKNHGYTELENPIVINACPKAL